jgi:hypothetical protein
MKTKTRKWCVWPPHPARLQTILKLGLIAALSNPVFAGPSTVIGVDVTVDSFSSRTVVDHILAFAQARVSDGEAVYVFAITAQTFTNPIQLARITLPQYAGIKGKDRKAALDELVAQLSKNLDIESLRPRGLLRQSRISDFFVLAANVFETEGVPERDRRMMIVSDMLQVDESHNWESSDLLSANDIQIPKVGGFVFVYGVASPKYRTSKKWKTVQLAWYRILDSAGIHVGCYSSTFLR